jgi:hypothetical protein
MTDTFRALCAELLHLDSKKPSEYADAVTYENWRQQWKTAIARTRDALVDEPAYDAGHAAGTALERNPGRLTATEVMLASNPGTARVARDYYTRGMEDAYRSVKDIVECRPMPSIVIERPPAPPSDGEVAELVEWLEEEADDYACLGNTEAAAKCNRAAGLLQRLALPEVGE